MLVAAVALAEAPAELDAVAAEAVEAEAVEAVPAELDAAVPCISR